MNKSWRTIISLSAISALIFSIHGVASASDGQTLTDKFRLEFTNRNPALTEIHIIESRPITPHKRFNNHLYLVRAIRPDHKFEGSFEDEQFGVFLVDTDRNLITKVLDMFNTPRWGDYEIRIKRTSRSRVTVNGRGATYGDGPIERTYNIDEKQ
jgi:hypothetical protein